MVRIAAGEGELGDRADVQVVPPAPLDMAVGELAVDDRQRGVGCAATAPGDEAHLVAPEQTVPQAQLPAFESNAGAVEVIDPGADEVDVVDLEIASANDPDRLAFGALPVGKEARRAVDAAYCQALLLPHGDVAAVVTGLDLDHVAVAGQSRGVGHAQQWAVRPDAPDLGARGHGLRRRHLARAAARWRRRHGKGQAQPVRRRRRTKGRA